jgi:hypothetical protein
MVVNKSYGIFFVTGVNSDSDREVLQEMRNRYGSENVIERSFYSKNISVTRNGQTTTVPYIFQDLSNKNRKDKRKDFAMRTRKNAHMFGLPKNNCQDRTKKKRW